MAKEVREDLITMGELMAAMWGVRDHCCAPVLAEQVPPIATALVAILERNPRMLAALAVAENAALIMQIVALGRAVAPVAQAVYRNHGPGAGRRGAGDDGGGEQSLDGGQAGVDLDAFPVFSGVPRAHAS